MTLATYRCVARVRLAARVSWVHRVEPIAQRGLIFADQFRDENVDGDCLVVVIYRVMVKSRVTDAVPSAYHTLGTATKAALHQSDTVSIQCRQTRISDFDCGYR